MNLKKGIDNMVSQATSPRKYLNIGDDANYYEDIIDKLGYSSAVEYGDGLNRGKVYADDNTLEQIRNELLNQEGFDLEILEDDGFAPTKETIWNDPKHPLYSIAPSEQNEEFLGSAIKELERNLQSPAHFKFYTKGSGGTMADARKQLARYKRALDYIRGGK